MVLLIHSELKIIKLEIPVQIFIKHLISQALELNILLSINLLKYSSESNHLPKPLYCIKLFHRIDDK
jgi:hypothetical protein